MLIAAAAAAGFIASLYWPRAQPAQPLTSGVPIVPSRGIAPFELIDMHGAPFTAASLRGHWSILYFGYTHCPDLCPATLSTLSALMKSLRASREATLPAVVFISVDARRDTPRSLADYVPFFDASFLGVTGRNQDEVLSAASRFGVAVVLGEQKNGGYTVDHSNVLLVISPQAKLTAVLTSPFNVRSLKSDWQRITAGAS